MRRCIYDKINKDEIERLFPHEVLPQIQRLLTLLLQKLQNEWREDVLKEEVRNFACRNMPLNVFGSYMEFLDE